MRCGSIIASMKAPHAIGLVVGAVVVGAGGIAVGRYVVPTSVSKATPPSLTTTSTTTSPGQMLPIAVQSTNDGVSETATVLMPSSCVLSDSMVTATGRTGFVANGYPRLGDVVEAVCVQRS